MKLTKHVGSLKELGTKVLVVFMQLPDDPSHALVVATHTLPDLVQDELMRMVQSDEGQAEKNLGDFLSRKTLSNGHAGSVLNWLHTSGKLNRVPVSSVMMVPHPGHPIALSELIALMDAPVSTNTSLVTTKTVSAEEQAGIVKGLLIEAAMLREEADKKEKQAHSMMPGDLVEKPKKTRKSKKSES